MDRKEVYAKVRACLVEASDSLLAALEKEDEADEYEAQALAKLSEAIEILKK